MTSGVGNGELRNEHRFEWAQPVCQGVAAVGRVAGAIFKGIGKLVDETEGLGLLLRGVSVVILSVNHATGNHTSFSTLLSTLDTAGETLESVEIFKDLSALIKNKYDSTDKIPKWVKVSLNVVMLVCNAASFLIFLNECSVPGFSFVAKIALGPIIQCTLIIYYTAKTGIAIFVLIKVPGKEMKIQAAAELIKNVAEIAKNVLTLVTRQNVAAIITLEVVSVTSSLFLFFYEHVVEKANEHQRQLQEEAA